jgi:hypothetical protein
MQLRRLEAQVGNSVVFGEAAERKSKGKRQRQKKKGKKKKKKRSSVWVVSGGLPSLGKHR